MSIWQVWSEKRKETTERVDKAAGENMKVLVICDDIWHPAEVICKGIKELDSSKYQFDIVMSAKDILTPELIGEYPVIINAKGNAINAANCAPWFEPTVTEVGPGEFLEYVEAGGGFISLHAGNTFGADSCKEYCDFVGNSFVTHPLRCPVTVCVTKMHPITEGVENFTERDEHYQLDHFADDMEVFLETESEPGGRQVAGYTRNLGEGRLCVLTPGHTLAVWKNKNFQTLLMNAIDWCAQK